MICLTHTGILLSAGFSLGTQIPDPMRAKRKTIVGTHYWKAPEVTEHKKSSPKVDIWSLGIMALGTCLHNPPHYCFLSDKNVSTEMIGASSLNQHPLKVLRLIVTNDTSTIADPENFSSTFRDYLSDTLKVDPEMRPDATQLLQHPFFARAESLCSLAPLINAACKAPRER